MKLIINPDDKCLRCGKCCYIKRKGEWVPCRFLEFQKDGKTFCKIYHRRLGQKLPGGFECKPRHKVQWDYPGCPYNTDKPIHPHWRDKDGS